MLEITVSGPGALTAALVVVAAVLMMALGARIAMRGYSRTGGRDSEMNAAPRPGAYGDEGGELDPDFPVMLVSQSDLYTTIRIQVGEKGFDFYFNTEDGEFDGTGMPVDEGDEHG